MLFDVDGHRSSALTTETYRAVPRSPHHRATRSGPGGSVIIAPALVAVCCP
jgi:hypothetical protein